MKYLLLFLIIIFPFAQSATPKQLSLIKSEIPIDSIIKAENKTISESSFIIDSIILTGNKKTKDFLIFRELTFKVGDTLNHNQLQENYQKSRNNLIKLSLFNFVDFTDSLVGAGQYAHLLIQISFIERWYLWPFPIFEISDRNLNVWLKEKNFNRISYGIYLIKHNNRGRGELLRLYLRSGYDERYELSYQVPYFNHKQTLGATLGAGWLQKHEVPYRTIANKQEFIKDDDHYLFKQFYNFINFTYRPDIHQFHNFQIRYNFFYFDDTLLKLNPKYSFKGLKTNEYMTFAYKFISDHRDSKINPLTGHYFEGQISKSGFGLLKDGYIEMMDLTGSYRKYWEFPKRFYFSTDWTGKLSTNREQPYFYQRGFGYERNFVRGYELYVIDGQSFILGKNTLRYALVPERKTTIGFLKSEKFSKIHYALFTNLFLDAGYVDSFRFYDPNDLSNHLIYGVGLGIDLVTYYDMIFRMELSVNKQGEPGFYIHFKDTL
ncbi:MAG: POTRA domain-containing protein [Bacteroidales bacterium]|jgi:outer membrane protein assembly factor BamA|nr:hypothetical protein [Bacteroidales bacterium]MDI9592143.1 POTRA domain-containing protein [Bacteroidota bacterium]HOF80079.1 POTRA domain-containing protein [Bacteroidales bacterium]HOR75398.1 POTRA domain-containing protein [Bacteroidales bacterium]HPL10810.1 POTRA domain-containing protein [Bacteroidales bacterium]